MILPFGKQHTNEVKYCFSRISHTFKINSGKNGLSPYLLRNVGHFGNNAVRSNFSKITYSTFFFFQIRIKQPGSQEDTEC